MEIGSLTGVTGALPSLVENVTTLFLIGASAAESPCARKANVGKV